MTKQVVWEEVVTASGVGRAVQYIPTGDGKFEEWMDEHEPGWGRQATFVIELYREIWQAAKEAYSSDRDVPKLITEVERLQEELTKTTNALGAILTDIDNAEAEGRYTL